MEIINPGEPIEIKANKWSPTPCLICGEEMSMIEPIVFNSLGYIVHFSCFTKDPLVKLLKEAERHYEQVSPMLEGD